MKNYYALHYHMKFCGVKTVIENIFDSLKNSEFNLNLIYSSKKTQFKTKKNINIIDIPEIDYSDKHFKTKGDLIKKADNLKNRIKSNLDLSSDCIIHAHNVNLFKNSFLGMALYLLAKETDITILFQVHDFAEDHRKDRLNLMLNCTGKKDRIFGTKAAYPLEKNTFYLTINSRDKRLLQKIGIPKKRTFLFPNSIDTDFLTSKPQKTDLLIKNLKKYAENNNYHFDSKRKILLSPTKILKRKNILENILLLKVLNHINDEWQLLISLDAHSKQDKIYSKKIKEYVRKNNLPVVIGFGYNIISPDEKRTERFPNNIRDLFEISDIVLTCSEKEGFGFTYLEAWLADKKVVARKIPFLVKDFEENGIDLDHFYDSIMIDNKDFTGYKTKEQFKILDSLNYKSLLKQLEKTIKFIQDKNKKIIENNKKNIIKNYSIEAYGKKLRKIINKAKKTKEFSDPELDNKPLIDYFEND